MSLFSGLKVIAESANSSHEKESFDLDTVLHILMGSIVSGLAWSAAHIQPILSGVATILTILLLGTKLKRMWFPKPKNKHNHAREY